MLRSTRGGAALLCPGYRLERAKSLVAIHSRQGGGPRSRSPKKRSEAKKEKGKWKIATNQRKELVTLIPHGMCNSLPLASCLPSILLPTLHCTRYYSVAVVGIGAAAAITTATAVVVVSVLVVFVVVVIGEDNICSQC